MLASLHRFKFGKYHSVKKSLTIIIGCLLISSPITVAAQNTEIGFELGAYNYIGDLAKKFDFGNQSLGTQFFLRKHKSEALSIRLSAGFGKLKGEDNQAFDVFSANRSASFEGNYQNVDFQLEYHFLDYRNEKYQQRWTPYLLFGFGVYNLSGTDNFGTSYDTGMTAHIPIGVGIKYRLNRRWVLGVSSSVIKTFSDELDNVSEFTPNIKDYQGGNPHNDDFMFFTAFSLSYTFYRIVCPQGKFW